MTLDELYKRMIQIYCPEFIDLSTSTQIEIEENQNLGSDNFKKLKLNSHASCIVIKDLLLKNSNNSYYGANAPKLNLECDKIIITEIEGKKYVLLFEIKSSFCSGLSNGIPQLRASCFKIQSYLNCIDGFYIDDYIFHAILASWKPTTEQLTKIRKKEYIRETLSEREELMKRVFVKDIVNSLIDSTRMEPFYKLPLKPTYLQELPISFFTTEYANTSAIMDIESVV